MYKKNSPFMSKGEFFYYSLCIDFIPSLAIKSSCSCFTLAAYSKAACISPLQCASGINKKIDELDEEHSRLKKEIADMSADIYGKKDVGVIKNYLNNWESISISDKITVVDALIESVRVNQDTVDIVWKI